MLLLLLFMAAVKLIERVWIIAWSFFCDSLLYATTVMTRCHFNVWSDNSLSILAISTYTVMHGQNPSVIVISQSMLRKWDSDNIHKLSITFIALSVNTSVYTYSVFISEFEFLSLWFIESLFFSHIHVYDQINVGLMFWQHWYHFHLFFPKSLNSVCF